MNRLRSMEAGELPEPMAAGRIGELSERYADRFTDLLLVRR